jgi:hypothetical protein
MVGKIASKMVQSIRLVETVVTGSHGRHWPHR